nr:hypothetical protein [Eubacterium sp.]
SPITDIYYQGTSEEWAAVNKGTGNTVFDTATMHFNELPECDTHIWNDGEVTTPPTCAQK